MTGGFLTRLVDIALASFWSKEIITTEAGETYHWDEMWVSREVLESLGLSGMDLFRLLSVSTQLTPRQAIMDAGSSVLSDNWDTFCLRLAEDILIREMRLRDPSIIKEVVRRDRLAIGRNRSSPPL